MDSSRFNTDRFNVEKMSLVPIAPKALSVSVHTGNIVNWNRLKKTLTQSPTEELTECISSTIETWLESTDRDKLQCETDIQCYNQNFIEPLQAEERLEYKLTVKVFLNNLRPEAVVAAVENVMAELGVTFIEVVILSVPDKRHDICTLQPLWQTLEQLVASEKVYSLGISDLKKEQLEELYNWAQVKPVINQVNLTTCCVIPQDLTEFAKAHDIQLLTHNDPTVILSDEGFQEIISMKLSPYDSDLWQPSWVSRYSVLIKCRGIIKSKGYIMRAVRQLNRPQAIDKVVTSV